MIDPVTREDAILLLAESVVELAKQQRAAAEAMVSEMREMVESIRSMSPPEVRLDAPMMPTMPAPVVNVPAPIVNVQMPDVQRVEIVGLPPLRARMLRDQSGRITGVEDQ